MKRRSKRFSDRLKKRERMRAARAAGMKNPSGKSRYGRKHAWLTKNGLWGWEVVPPLYQAKPWRGAA